MTYPGLPKKVKVGPITYAVLTSPQDYEARLRDEEEPGVLEGWSQGRRAEIGLRPEMNVQYARQVMVHELLHQVLTVNSMQISADDEEVVVRALEAGLLQVLRDNPALVKWLTDK